MTWEEEYGAMIGIVDTSYDTPRQPETAARDIVTQRQDVGTSGNDSWGGFFQKAVGQVLEYGIKKDAAETGVKLQASQYAQPTYRPVASVGSGGLTVSPMLLIMAGVVAFVVLKK